MYVYFIYFIFYKLVKLVIEDFVIHGAYPV